MENKFWLDSQTVRASLVTVIPMIALILKAFHVEIGNDEQNSIIEGLAAVAGLVGVVHVIVGRFKATKPLTFNKGE